MRVRGRRVFGRGALAAYAPGSRVSPLPAAVPARELYDAVRTRLGLHQRNSPNPVAKNSLQRYLCNMSGAVEPPTGAPSDAVVLDAHNLRALTHPVRVQLLGLLRSDGSSTATRLGQRTGLSSAATSYHLRQLATYGFVVEDSDAEREHGRERWWRAAHRMTVLDTMPLDPDDRAVAGEYLRAVAQRYVATIHAWLDEWPTAPEPWRGAATISDDLLLLTPAEAEKLQGAIEDLVATARRHDPQVDRPPGAQPVVVQWQVLPQIGAQA